MSAPRTALVIVGHGSTVNSDSSAPTHEHADEIRRRGLFDEVHCAFWKEEPSMREVFYGVESETIFVVPNFISEGYFTREVLPREMRLEGPITERDGRKICYCDPVGIHSSMTRLLLKRADEVAADVPRSETSLIIVGHGTGLNEQSRKAIEAQVALIRAGQHGFAEVLDAYMEEAPFIAKWDEISSAPHVVVAPFFIADGLHSFEDIPVLLGINAEPGAAASENDVFRHNPHALRGRKLYYSSAIGTESLMADVILDQVRDFCQIHALAFPESSAQIAPLKSPPLPSCAFTMGQVRATPLPDGAWRLQHTNDESLDGLESIPCSPAAARVLSQYDAAGKFRSLKTAPTLRRGWVLVAADEAALRLVLNSLYPGELGLYHHWRSGTLHPVHLRETLSRQTGMYRFANTISDEQAQLMVACECDAASKCLRRITWQIDSQVPLSLPAEKTPPLETPDTEISLICVEACTHVVSAAREVARNSQRAHEAKT